LEKAGIPTVQITSALPVAKMIGANRLVLGNGIVHVVGDASLSPNDEKTLRRQLIEKALKALQDDGRQSK
jgi:glycine reductase complex component B subunit gamma